MKKVFITRHLFEDAVVRLRERFAVDWRDEEDGLSEPAFRHRVRNAHGLVCQLTDQVTENIVEVAPELKVVANVAVGYDNIDVAACTERGIVVTNTPGVLADTTADFAFSLMLATARRLVEAEHFVRSGKWQQWSIDLLCGQDVYGQTLGIVGMGQIGQAMARRGRGFGMRVVYSTRTPTDAFADDPWVEAVSFDTLLEVSDFVSLHVPLTPETRLLIGPRELGLMKQSAILVNTARGAIVDESALAEALIAGSIGGAGLDVFTDEPQVDSRLLAAPNTVLAPHIASASYATRRRMCVMAAENVQAVLEGRRPANPVNLADA